MADMKDETSALPVKTEAPAATALTVDTNSLKKESLALINQIITETNDDKTQDLTYLFNMNQNKKTMVRINKLNELLDVITDQAVTRFSSKPDEISNKELIDGLKTVQDLIERGQNQVNGGNSSVGQPLIQINQQTNSVNVGKDEAGLSRDSREKVKNVVLALLNNVTSDTSEQEPKKDQNQQSEVIDLTETDTLGQLKEDSNDD